MNWMAMITQDLTGTTWVYNKLFRLFDTLYLFFILGEYIKDINFELLQQDRLLNHKIPRPLVEKGHCMGIWMGMEQAWESDEYYTNRDCMSYDPTDYLQPLSRLSSKVSSIEKGNIEAPFLQELLWGRQEDLFRIAVYYQPEQNFITKITKDAKMSLSDKISWIGGMMGLFTGKYSIVQ